MSEAEPTRETHNPLGETGRRLREAREARRQSLSEVAECLHLRPSIVSAIEDGDYRQIPGELFLKGYVKSYARHLGLDEESMIERLEQELEPLREEDERARIEHPLEEIQRRKEQRRRTGKWLAGVAVIAVAVLAYVAFTQFGASFNHKAGGVSPSVPTAQNPTSGAMATQTGQAQAGQSQSPAAQGASGVSAASQPTATPEMKQPAAAALQQAPKQTAVSSPKPGTGSESSSAGQAASSSVASATAAASSNAGAQSQAGQTGSGQTHSGQYTGATLTGTFGGDCWIEVKNGDGVEVIAALKRAGDKVYYRGPPPFHVVLGAVSQVSQMTYNGKPVDLKKYPSPGNRAEFVLGKKKD